MALRFGLREFGTTFATREVGAELRDTVLARSAGESCVVIDFTDVTNVSYSFADEFLGKLVAEQDAVSVELLNMTPSVDRTMCSARQRRAGASAR